MYYRISTYSMSVLQESSVSRTRECEYATKTGKSHFLPTCSVATNVSLLQICRLSDLKREAAFNLSLIYKASDNHELALHYIRHYCRV